MMWNPIFLVAAGGAIGSVARYLLSGAILHTAPSARFPWPTFAINVLGSLFFGVLAGLTAKLGTLEPPLRLFLLTGVLGGFTTFSAFSFETLYLLRIREPLLALAYSGGSAAIGLLAVWIGLLVSRA